MTSFIRCVCMATGDCVMRMIHRRSGLNGFISECHVGHLLNIPKNASVLLLALRIHRFSYVFNYHV